MSVIDFDEIRLRKLQELARKFRIVDINLHILWSREKNLILDKQQIADQIKSMCPYKEDMSNECKHPARSRRRKEIFGKEDKMCLCNMGFCPYIEEE